MTGLRRRVLFRLATSGTFERGVRALPGGRSWATRRARREVCRSGRRPPGDQRHPVEVCRFIERTRRAFPITLMCEMLEASRSGYYDWRDRQPSPRQREEGQVMSHGGFSCWMLVMMAGDPRGGLVSR